MAWWQMAICLRAVHAEFYILPLDEWNPEFWPACRKIREYIEGRPFNKVFDLIQFVLRHPQCPREFSNQMKRTFAECMLAYTIDDGPPPTIIPAVTPEEGGAVVNALRTLRQSGLDGSAVHLREASERINASDWAGSVRRAFTPSSPSRGNLIPRSQGRSGRH